MSKKGKTIRIKIDTYDVLKHVRSPFANVHYSGCGAHKSKKDYNRQVLKLETKKSFLDY